MRQNKKEEDFPTSKNHCLMMKRRYYKQNRKYAIIQPSNLNRFQEINGFTEIFSKKLRTIKLNQRKMFKKISIWVKKLLVLKTLNKEMVKLTAIQ